MKGKIKEVNENRNTKDVAEQHRIGITKENCGMDNLNYCHEAGGNFSLDLNASNSSIKEGFSHE